MRLAQLLFPALGLIPRGILRRLSSRYITGESISDLVEVATALGASGILSTADVLGENSVDPAAVDRIVGEYRRLIDALSGRVRRSEVSIKPTLIGLRLGSDVAERSLAAVVDHAAERGVAVAIDMEDTSTTDATLRLFRTARARYEKVSVALQAYLHRSTDDLESILDLRPGVRICKGIYVEPARVALQDRRAIQENYLRLLDRLIDARGYPEIATHDPWLVDASLERLRTRGVLPEDHEFQMLLGVGESLRGRILGAGSALRLYCPYGPEWQAYSLRRLRENPRMFSHLLRSFFSLRMFRSDKHLSQGRAR